MARVGRRGHKPSAVVSAGTATKTKSKRKRSSCRSRSRSPQKRQQCSCGCPTKVRVPKLSSFPPFCRHPFPYDFRPAINFTSTSAPSRESPIHILSIIVPNQCFDDITVSFLQITTKRERSPRRVTWTMDLNTSSTRIHEENCEPVLASVLQEPRNVNESLTAPEGASPSIKTVRVPHEDQARSPTPSGSKDPKNINQ